MDSHPWTYRQNQHVAPALQTSQALTQHFQNGTSIQQNAHSQQQYRTLTNGVSPQQSSQGWSRRWLMGTLSQNGKQLNRNGNFQRIINNGSQASTQHVPQNPPQRSSTQSQPIMMNANMAVHGMAHQNSSQNLYRRPENTSVPSFPNEHTARSHVLVPPAAHNLHHRQNSTQNGCLPPATLPDYNTAVSQSLRNRDIISSVSVQQAVGGFSMSHVVQRNQNQPNNSRPSDSLRPSRTNVGSSYSFDDLRQIAKIVEDLHKSVPAEFTGHPSENMGSSYPVMESNLNVQAVDNSSYALQSSALSSQRSSSKTLNITTQQTQHSNKAPHHHNSVPNTYLRAAGNSVTDGRTSSNAFFPTNTQGSSRNQGQTLRPESQLSTNQRQAERLLMEMLCTSKTGALHSSPGRTRAVAVVPPLSQDAAQHASPNMTNSAGFMTDESVCDSRINDNINKAKELWNKSSLVPEISTPEASDKSKVSDSSASNSDSASLSDSTKHRDLSLKHLGTDNTQAEQAVGHIPPNAPGAEGSESAVTQHKEPSDFENHFLELSKIQTIDCRSSELEKIVGFFEEKLAAQSTSSKMQDPGVSIVAYLWGGNYKKCETLIESDWYEKITLNAKTFCDQHVTADTVIASRVKKCHAAFLQQHHILKNNEVYTEPPYKSSWLNLNEQLDDIDKEFGLPWPLRRHACTPETDFQLDEAELLNSIPAPIRSDSPNKELEPEPVNLFDQNLCETSTQTVLPNRSECSDPLNSLQLKVLPLEEAIAIFKQAGGATNVQQDMEENKEEMELQEVFGSSFSDSTQQCKSVSPIEEVCCVEMLKQIFYGLGTASGECQCQKEQSRNEVTDPTADEGVAAEPGKHDMFVIQLDSKSEEENLAKGLESTNTETIRYNHTTYPPEDEESNTIPSLVISNPSSIMLMSENEVDGGSRSDDRDSEQPADLEDGSGPAQDRTNDSKITNQPREDSEVQSENQSDNPADGKQDQSSHVLPDFFSCESEDLGEKPSETIKEQRVTHNLSHSTAMRKEKRPLSHDQRHSSKKLKKCPKAFSSAQTPEDVSGSRDSLADHQRSSSHYRTVKLALFGSQDEYYPGVSKKTPVISSASPPGVISVLVSPPKRKPSKPVPAEEPSVKFSIYEKWRKSLYQSQMMQRCTLRIQKMRLKKSGLKETVVSKKRREKSTKRLLSKLIKQRKEKRKRDVAALRDPADQQTQDAEERSYTVRPVQDKNVLVFSVLPTSFSLQDGPSETGDPDDPAPSETKPVEIKSPKTAMSREKASTWNPPCSEKKKDPPQRPTSSLFQDFQKKYKEKTQQA